MDLPPPTPEQLSPPRIAVKAPTCHYLTQWEAEYARAKLGAQLASTKFVSARASEICGLVRLETEGGKVVYTDPTGRYLLLTFALDTHKGEPADNQAAMEEAFEARSGNELTADGPRMSVGTR